MKNVVIIAGLSASGKSTVLDYMVENLGYEKLVTTTTRDPRPGEVNGVDYHFLSKEDFKNKKNEGYFLENVEIKGNFYGTGLNAFQKDFGDKKPVLILDPVGVVEATKILEKEGWKVNSVFIDESPETCIERVLSRDASPEEQKKRVNDINTVEKGWGTHTNYKFRTIPGSSIEKNAKDIDEFNKTQMNQKVKVKRERKSRNGKKFS